LGATIGHLMLKKDAVAMSLGIAAGLGPAFAIGCNSPWFVLATPLFVYLAFRRKQTVLQKNAR